MSDETTAIREAASARLPELERTIASLTTALESILSPAAVAALRTPNAAFEIAPLTAEPDAASALLRDLDSRLPVLRAAQASAVK